jgi:hypothetical protein
MDFNTDFLKSVIRNHSSDQEYYSTVLNTVLIPHDFFYHNLEIFNTNYLIKYCLLEEETIEYFLDEYLFDGSDDLNHLLKYQQLSVSCLTKYINTDNVNWHTILEYQDISCNILQMHVDKLDWLLVSENQFMDLQFLIRNIEHIEWEQLPFNSRMKQFINEGMITLFQQTNIWNNIGYCDNIDTDTLLKYSHKFNSQAWESLKDHRDITMDQIKELMSNVEKIE